MVDCQDHQYNLVKRLVSRACFVLRPKRRYSHVGGSYPEPSTVVTGQYHVFVSQWEVIVEIIVEIILSTFQRPDQSNTNAR